MKVGAVAAMAFAGLLGGAISTFAPATPGFEHVLGLIGAAVAALKLGAASAGLVTYRPEQVPPPAAEE